MPNKLRLLVTKSCDRKCPGCCNQDWDLDGLERLDFSEIREYSEILITGGEPMLYPTQLMHFLRKINDYAPWVRVYMYTARTKRPAELVGVMAWLDGLTLTLHTRDDADRFMDFKRCMPAKWLDSKSLRLNVFKEVEMDDVILDIIGKGWEVKNNMEWIKDCPLPEGEVFKKWIIK